MRGSLYQRMWKFLLVVRGVLWFSMGWHMSYVMDHMLREMAWVHNRDVRISGLGGGYASGRYGMAVHVTAATTASSTKWKGSSSQLAVRSTQEGKVEL